MRTLIALFLLASLALAQTPTPTPAQVVSLILEPSDQRFAALAEKPAFEPRLWVLFKCSAETKRVTLTATGGNLPTDGAFMGIDILEPYPVVNGWRETTMALPADLTPGATITVTAKCWTEAGSATATALR